MYLSSGQTALEAPGLPFGLVELPKGWTRTLLQLIMIILSPFTILLLRLQYELTLARWQLGKELQNENLINEFGQLSLLLKVGKFQKDFLKSSKQERKKKHDFLKVSALASKKTSSKGNLKSP